MLNAGSSAGRDDYTKQIIEETGSVFCHGIAIKPGKPTILGVCGHVPVIGLPGYPVSAMVVLENIVFPVIELFTKNTPLPDNAATASISRRIVSNLKYREFLRVKLGIIAGKLVATPMERGAGAVSSLARADGIVTIPCDSEGLEAGVEAEVTLLRPLEEIRKALVVTGSHDPMLDVMGDIMRKTTDLNISSTHVGSMGGIMAIMRGEAHIAPIHLLDTVSGEYNKSYVDKYLDGKGSLIKGVKRTQGILVRKGNPKGITGIFDLCKKDVTYVNRQKGAGTRILFDFLLQNENITHGDIHGYENEEYTHTAVAAQIAGGNADAGMGIYSAAKIFNLDFIPIADEEYDFIISKEMQSHEAVLAFQKILRSDEMKNILAELGGYKFG
jgi:putative molybdopterin biosynthesis protein